MLSQLSEEKKKKPDFQNAVGNLKSVANGVRANMVKESTNTTTPANNQTTPQTTSPTKNKSLNDYATVNSQTRSNGIEAEAKGADTEPKGFDGKKFKSRYIDDNGAWTRESVDD